MEHENLSYRCEKTEVTTDVASFIERFRDAERVSGYCRQCHNYGKRHGCPPFDFDPMTIIGRFTQVKVTSVKVYYQEEHLPLSKANRLLRPVTINLNARLLEQERQLGGYMLGFVGVCPFCDSRPCARQLGKPCLHPDKVRPSLEAFGFDVTLIASELLHTPILWGKDGFCPEHFTLVCAVLIP